jgi:hypothetical protein
MSDELDSPFERRSRQLFEDSVGNVDMRVRSRLNQARHAALDAAARPRATFFGLPLAASAGGVCAAALLGIALWVGVPAGHHAPGASDAAASFEDLDIVAATEECSGDTLEMLQDDADFYDWAADKSASSDANGVG